MALELVFRQGLLYMCYGLYVSYSLQYQGFMGQNNSNPFHEGGAIMNDFQVQQKMPELFLTFLIQKSTNKEYLLRELTFNELREFSIQLEKLQKRKQISHPNLTNLQIVEDRAEDQMCSSFYKIYSLWQYPTKSLLDDIAIRTLENRPYQVKQMWSLLSSCISALAALEQHGIAHECLTSKAILFEQNANVKVADPMSFGLTTNLEYVLSNRYNKSIYLSPEQCESIASHRPILNKNSYKNDVFTLALIILQAGLMEKQDKCYLEDCSLINFTILNKNISRLGDRYGHQLRQILSVMANMQIQYRPDWTQLQPRIDELKNKKSTSLSNQSGKAPISTDINVSKIVKEQPPTIVMPAQPNFAKLLMGTQPLSVIQSVSNEGGSSIKQSNIASNQHHHQYSNISSIPPYSFVSPIAASNNTSNLNHYEQQFPKALQMKSNIQPNDHPSAINQFNFLPSQSNHSIISSTQNHPVNIRFASQLPNPLPSNVVKDMTVTFGGRMYQNQQQIAQPNIERITRQAPPIGFRSEIERVQLPVSTTPPVVYQNRLGKSEKESSMQRMSSNPKISTDSQAVEVYEEFTKGSRYNGFKLNGMRHGKGTFYYQDGGRYEGDWKCNKMTGYGRLFYQSDKLAYEGEWLNDQFNGKGKLYNENPEKIHAGFDFRNFDQIDEFWEYYEGQFDEDLKNGRGKLRFSNGELFEGTFVDDMVQGEGVFYCRDGQRIHGVWMENKLIQMLN